MTWSLGPQGPRGLGGWAACSGGEQGAAWVMVSPGDPKGPAGSLLTLGTSLDPSPYLVFPDGPSGC